MNDLNSILLEGRLTIEPELKYTNSGIALCTFTLVVNRYIKYDGNWKEEVSFFNIEVWNKLAENIVENFHKGDKIRIIGRLRQDRWQGKDGRIHSKVIVVSDHIERCFNNKKGGKNVSTKRKTC